MIKADILIYNGTILTMDSQNTTIPNGILAISGNKISYIGKNGKDLIEAKKEFDTQGGLILPGLINSHTHAAMSLFRGLADRVRLRILNAISQNGAMTGTELSAALKLPRSTVARHLRYLYRSRLVTTAHSRGETRYGLRTETEPIHRRVVTMITRELRDVEGVEKDNQRLRPGARGRGAR